MATSNSASAANNGAPVLFHLNTTYKVAPCAAATAEAIGHDIGALHESVLASIQAIIEATDGNNTNLQRLAFSALYLAQMTEGLFEEYQARTGTPSPVSAPGGDSIATDWLQQRAAWASEHEWHAAKTVGDVCDALKAWIAQAAATENADDEWNREEARQLWPALSCLVDEVGAIDLPGDTDSCTHRHGVITLLDSNATELREYANAESDVPPYARAQINNARCALEILERLADKVAPATAAASSNDATSKVSKEMVVEDDVWKASVLNGLAEWIATARQQIDEVQGIAKLDAALAERLKQWNFAIGEGDWTESEQSGLRALHQEIGCSLARISKATTAAGRAASAS